MGLKEVLENASLVFWDFDGVIKESVTVKTDAFCRMMSPYGKDVVDKVKTHHEANGGVTRFKKIPFYFTKYAGIQLSEEELAVKYKEFSDLVVDEVISCPWVQGAENFLKRNPYKQRFILVTGTPQVEIETILHAINLGDVFESVFGAPEEKSDVVQRILSSDKISTKEVVFLGDAYTDLHAARLNGVKFFLRETPINGRLKKEYDVETFSDFSSVLT